MGIALQCLTGSTAAGFGILFRGSAGVAVAQTSRAVPVLLAASAGVHREIIIFIINYWFGLFWHCVTNRMYMI